ncbi:MAG: DUF1566 domain-containing protein [Saprospiraceae bacterium]|nr:DUF1566 domain-containing protein [Saprospiraceae bacterium]
MKSGFNLPLLTIQICLFLSNPLLSQNLQVEGNARISEMNKDNTADSVVVRLSDGSLGVRDVSTLTEFQVISISNDTVYLTNGAFIVLPDASSTNEIQDLESVLTQDSSAAGQRIKDLKDPMDPQDAVTKAFLDQMLVNFGITLGTAGLQALLNAGITPLQIINAGVDVSAFIGLDFGGGKIFYLKNDGTGLVAASSDQSTGTPWGCESVAITGADGIDLGTGAQNTVDIEAGCLTPGTAADICANLDLNGFDDWFLPSKNELNELNIQSNQIGGFIGVSYWSSSEISPDLAWAQFFGGGNQNATSKSNLNRVRAIRAF